MLLVQTAGGKAVDPEFLETHLSEVAFLWLLAVRQGQHLASSMNLAPKSCYSGLHLTTHHCPCVVEKIGR